MSLFKKKKAAPVAQAAPVLAPVAAPAPVTPDDNQIREAVRMDELKQRRKQQGSKTLLSGATGKPATTSQTLLGKW